MCNVAFLTTCPSAKVLGTLVDTKSELGKEPVIAIMVLSGGAWTELDRTKSYKNIKILKVGLIQFRS